MSGNEHGADAFVCQHFDEYGVRHAPVDDKDTVHAPADGVHAAGHLRQHAAADDAGRDECVRLCRMDDGDEVYKRYKYKLSFGDIDKIAGG